MLGIIIIVIVVAVASLTGIFVAQKDPIVDKKAIMEE